ncbi:hypothetical protein GCM10023314_01600 [Algibacter agarivorans]|uniref:Uncharacterized protein n=1 Tax=Algibacter agarivorans TaxID=1109741 RepID=A0ABP9G9C9_9FLAO
MLNKTDIQTKTSTVFHELEKEIDSTQKEATKVLRIHHGKFRFHMNEGTMDSEDYLKSEKAWDNIDQKLKTLKHIKLILEKYRNVSGVVEESEALDKELLNYSNIATQKELHNIAELFTDYRTRFAIENSDVDELIKLKIKSKTNSQFIKETFIKACQNLDASIFEPLIDEDQYFEELDKYRFLQSMKTQFDYLKGEGIKEVKLVMGKCEMCFIGAKVHEFYVKPNIGKPAFSYNIQEENGEIKDIFRCNLSSGYGRAAREDRDPDITYINYD